MIIAVDFDGTCVTHKFPYVGENIGAVPVLKRLTQVGHRIILYTMRSHRRSGTAEPNSLQWDNSSEIQLETDVLQDAIDWFTKHNIPLYAVNENPSQKNWTDSSKVYAQLYIDNAALGTPLIYPKQGHPYVDWKKIEQLLIQNGVI